jgi:cytochrome c oxidase subunit 2
MNTKLVATLALLWITSAPTGAALAADTARGEALYDLCGQCHGPDGGGGGDPLAPAIAGLEEWYVTAQLYKFRNGARGAHPADSSGLRMRPMSRTLANDDEVRAVAAYVSSLPTVRTELRLAGGDVSKGQERYQQLCITCHGPDGKGIEQLAGAPIAHASDWYLLSQLQKFKSGVRGANPLDETGARMRPMAMILPDEQAMKDVIAYIMTLSR